MPIFNWNKYRDTSKGKYLIKELKKANKLKCILNGFYYGVKFLFNSKSFDIDYYNNAWNVLYQQYIDKFGFDDSFQEVLKLKLEQFKKMTEHMSSDIDRRKKFTITEVKILDRQIADVEKNIPTGDKQDFESVKVYVDKWLSSVIDDKKTSVVQYQYYINEMSKPQKTA